MSQPAPTEKQLVGEIPSPSPTVDVEAGVAPKECWMKKKEVTLIFRALTLIFRASALLFSVLSFMLMVTVTEFTKYPPFNFVFIVVFVVMIYTAVLVGIHGHEVRTGEVVIPPKVAAWMNFLGDQFLALMLLSAGSAGGEAALAFRNEGYQDSGKATASIAMTFFTFLALEPAALMSTYHFFIYITKS